LKKHWARVNKTRPSIVMHTEISISEERRYAELQSIALDFARKGETGPLEEMLRHGLPPNLADAKGNTLLMLASYNGWMETSRMLLKNGAEVDRRNDRGQTPLGGVAFKGYTDIVALLLQHGADIDADNGGGMTPLMFAAMFGRTTVVEQLKIHGASLQRRNRFGISARGLVWFSNLLGRLRSRNNVQLQTRVRACERN
jgi:ankyrin repeat protein